MVINIRMGRSNTVHIASPMNLVRGQMYTICGRSGEGTVTDEPITCEDCERLKKRTEG
jgi:hypothetical protein